MVHDGGRYRAFIEEPIMPMKDTLKEEAVRTLTESWSRVVENYVRQYPEQWVWMHDRWKTKNHVEGQSEELRKAEQITS